MKLGIWVVWGLPSVAVAGTLDLVQQVRVLNGAGAPIDGDHDVVVQLVGDATPGAPDVVCHTTNLGTLPFAEGYAGLLLTGVPSGCFAAPKWIATIIDGGELLPRHPVFDVPRAGVARQVFTTTSPGSCDTAGEVVFDTNADALLVCDGSDWIETASGAFPFDSSGGTTCSVAGDVRWTGTDFQGCNGSQWLSIAGPGSPPIPDKIVFTGTNGPQLFRVPADVSSITVKLWGAGGGGGGAGGWSLGFVGGAGGFATGTLAVTPGELLTVMVGQGGGYAFPYGATPNYGGGGGHIYDFGVDDMRYAGSGGGRTAIRRGDTELLTAGGGGGGGSRNTSGTNNAGGGGGGIIGQPGWQGAGTPAQGGSSSSGGTGALGSSTGGTAGVKFDGGGPLSNSYGGGGGGGWYGGGGGAHAGDPMGGGGGGSSYISGPGVTGASTTPASGATVPETANGDYLAGAGAAGPVGGSGGNGLAIIRFDTDVLPSTATKVSFNYTGADRTWTVPAGVNEVLFKVWGAGGGGGGPGGWSQGFPGGAGGYTTAVVPVTAGQVFTLQVGERGAYQFPNGATPGYGGGGGYGGSEDNRYGASGGGRSSVLRGGVEVLVAGGGGGGASRNGGAPISNGGAGGGLVGESGYQNAGTPAGGGTQSAGGTGATGSSTGGTAGARFVGGRPVSNSYGGGGGGGYYGGGGGAHAGDPMGGGAGGSGHIRSSDVTWGVTTTGWRQFPPGGGDADFPSGVAFGGPQSGVGGHGFILVEYQ